MLMIHLQPFGYGLSCSEIREQTNNRDQYNQSKVIASPFRLSSVDLKPMTDER